MSDNIYKRVANYVTNLYEANPHPNLVFHNLAHTKRVVERSQEIAAHYQLSENDTLTIYVAAWFHDVGHLFTEMEGHETKSVEIMEKYLGKEEGSNDKLVTDIAGCIMATRMPHKPANQLQEILCDADTYHFGTKEFKTTNKQIKKEFTLRGNTAITIDWAKNTVDLLESHTFFTSYCKVLLEGKKRENIEWLKKKRDKTGDSNTHHNMFSEGADAPSNKKAKESFLSRGVQTMIRLTSSNHFHLSEMADRKANILISVNSIIIGVVLSVLIDKLSEDTYLTIPVIVLLSSALSTIIIAILSTRPKITEGKFTNEDILNKRTNLLFFGNFYKSSLEDYQWAMSVLMKDNDFLYSVMIKDIHQIGVILGRKYKLIRLAYNVFMIGLIISVLVFFIAAMIKFGHPVESTVITNASGSAL